MILLNFSFFHYLLFDFVLKRRNLMFVIDNIFIVYFIVILSQMHLPETSKRLSCPFICLKLWLCKMHPSETNKRLSCPLFVWNCDFVRCIKNKDVWMYIIETSAPYILSLRNDCCRDHILVNQALSPISIH
jgi:hypothetical protein